MLCVHGVLARARAGRGAAAAGGGGGRGASGGVGDSGGGPRAAGGWLSRTGAARLAALPAGVPAWPPHDVTVYHAQGKKGGTIPDERKRQCLARLHESGLAHHEQTMIQGGALKIVCEVCNEPFLQLGSSVKNNTVFNRAPPRKCDECRTACMKKRNSKFSALARAKKAKAQGAAKGH